MFTTSTNNCSHSLVCEAVNDNSIPDEFPIFKLCGTGGEVAGILSVNGFNTMPQNIFAEQHGYKRQRMIASKPAVIDLLGIGHFMDPLRRNVAANISLLNFGESWVADMWPYARPGDYVYFVISSNPAGDQDVRKVPLSVKIKERSSMALPRKNDDESPQPFVVPVSGDITQNRYFNDTLLRENVSIYKLGTLVKNEESRYSIADLEAVLFSRNYDLGNWKHRCLVTVNIEKIL